VELILIRHAEPAEPAEPGAIGRSPEDEHDPPLGARGRAQAEAVAARLLAWPIHRILSSPARRARETAAPLAAQLGLEPVLEPRLRDVGGTTPAYRSIERDRREDPARYRARLAAYRREDGLAAIAGRVNAALDEWIARHPGERVVAFCHGSVVNVFAASVLGLADAAFLEAASASVHRFRIARSGLRSVVCLNETAHLGPLETPLAAAALR